MRTLGLSASDFRLYLQQLRSPHERRIHVEIETLGGTLLRHLTLQLLDGQVDVDTTAEVSRVLNMSFLDPSRSLQFEPDSLGDAPLHRSRRVRVNYSVRVPALSEWISCPVFTGPIFDFNREGPVVSIVAKGMELQALGNQWNARTFAKKSKKTKALRALATDVGYTRMVIPDLRSTFPGRMTVARMDQPWLKMRKIAKSLDRHLFFDGAGVLRLRTYGNRPVYTFGDNTLLAEPAVRRDVEGLINVVEVYGKKPKGKKRRPHAAAPLQPGHDLSPQSLALNGQPLYLAERVEDEHLKTNAACFARARRLRDDRARLPVDISFESIPIPCLDEMDWVMVVTDDGPKLVRMQKWTLPLGGSASGGAAGEPMTVGYLRRTAKAHRRRLSDITVGAHLSDVVGGHHR